MDGAPKALALLLVLASAAPSDPGRWTSGPPLPTARSEVGVGAIGSRLYVVGGFARGGDQRLVEELDVAEGRWRERAPLPHEMNHVGVCRLRRQAVRLRRVQRGERCAVG